MGAGGDAGGVLAGGVLTVPPSPPPLLHAPRNRPANSNSESVEDSVLLDDGVMSNSFG